MSRRACSRADRLFLKRSPSRRKELPDRVVRDLDRARRKLVLQPMQRQLTCGVLALL
jgi:hypothetical protein